MVAGQWTSTFPAASGQRPCPVAYATSPQQDEGPEESRKQRSYFSFTQCLAEASDGINSERTQKKKQRETEAKQMGRPLITVWEGGRVALSTRECLLYTASVSQALESSLSLAFVRACTILIASSFPPRYSAVPLLFSSLASGGSCNGRGDKERRRRADTSAKQRGPLEGERANFQRHVHQWKEEEGGGEGTGRQGKKERKQNRPRQTQASHSFFPFVAHNTSTSRGRQRYAKQLSRSQHGQYKRKCSSRTQPHECAEAKKKLIEKQAGSVKWSA